MMSWVLVPPALTVSIGSPAALTSDTAYCSFSSASSVSGIRSSPKPNTWPSYPFKPAKCRAGNLSTIFASVVVGSPGSTPQRFIRMLTSTRTPISDCAETAASDISRAFSALSTTTLIDA